MVVTALRETTGLTGFRPVTLGKVGKGEGVEVVRSWCRVTKDRIRL